MHNPHFPETSETTGRRRRLLIWTLICVIAGGVFVAYVSGSVAAGQGMLLMPLDDVYIHFQYARQMAAGQPYVYNPGLPPSSGATSFLYPWLLAAGYLLGFQELNLGLWALGIGAVALACSGWLLYRLAKASWLPDWLAILFVLSFMLNGPVSWHFMSGMETGLVMLFTLWTMDALIPLMTRVYPHSPTFSSLRGEGEPSAIWRFVLPATLLALIRPEGGILAVIAVVVVWWRERTPIPGPSPVNEGREKSPESGSPPVNDRDRFGVSRRGLPLPARKTLWLLIPVLAVGVQPLVNLLATGSAVASGNAAKSVFGMVPFEWGTVLQRIVENFARMWTEFFTGISPREGMYLLPLMLVLSAVGLAALLVTRERRLLGVMFIGWLAAGTLMVSTLDTAFWHFKRYQMPFMALLVVLAVWGVGALWRASGSKPEANRSLETSKEVQRQFSTASAVYPTCLARCFKRPAARYLLAVAAGYMLLSSVWTEVQFWNHYVLNVGYIYQQPYSMAMWLQEHTPSEAVIAVHDTGLMRYLGGRTTIDMVGLTTPGAADYWRNGPGAVAEYLMQTRPDYIASYGPGHGLGLGMIADTSIYGKPLASFPVNLDSNYNVALAADFQGIYKPEWKTIRHWGLQDSLRQYVDVSKVTGTNNIQLDVADLASETFYRYSWNDVNRPSGFPTEVHEFRYWGCSDNPCLVADAGRRITGEENFAFRFAIDSGYKQRPVLLVTRVHPAVRGTFDIYVAGTYLGTRWIPEIPGYWLDIPTLIPEKYFHDPLEIRIVPNVPEGYYMPYMHTIYDLKDQFLDLPSDALSTFQDGAIVLKSATITYQPQADRMAIDFEWYTDGSAQGDYKLFVHVLDAKGQIVAQADTYPGGGTLPPGNWLPGILRDTIMVDLRQVPPGQYKVAIGFYNPYTFERLQPEGGDESGRFFIGAVTVE